MTRDLFSSATEYFNHGIKKLLPVKIDKKPTLTEWTPLRNATATLEQIKLWLSSDIAVGFGIILDNSWFVFDWDGLGGDRFKSRVLARSPKEIQDAYNITTRTKTPHGEHVSFRLNPDDFPDGIGEIECWKLLGENLEHNQILLLSQNKYLVECGPGYESIRGINCQVTLSKESVMQEVELLKLLRSESGVISNVIKILASHYYRDNRDRLVFTLSGYLHKYGVPEYLIKDTTEDLIDLAGGDEELNARYLAIKSTCDKDPAEVSGHEELLAAVSGDDSILLLIQKEFKKLGYFRFENEDRGSEQKSTEIDTDDSDDSDDKVNDIEVLRESIIELFKDQFERPYATVDINGHYEPLLVNPNSSKFRMWASSTYYRTIGKPLMSEHFTQACHILQGEACLFGDNEKKLDLRISSGPDNGGAMTFYYDLANKTRQVIKITQDGWTIEESTVAPIMFRRYQQTKAQVTPVRNYPPNIFDQFMKLINIKITDKDGNEIVDKTNNLKLLTKCYIISLFIPNIPQTVLMLYGPQGTAKTSSEESIKEAVDPSSVPTMALTKDIIQLIQQLSHNHLAYYDNVSRITEEQSDQISRASTGSGSTKRMLYSDDDDILYWYIRCVGISSINIVTSKPDLLDRAILVPSSTINEEDFQSIESYIKAERKRIIPQLLGYIFDILVKVLRIKNNGGIRLTKKSRMVDFCEYGEIISRCMGYPANSFTEAYSENIDRMTSAIIDSGIVAQMIMRFMDDKDSWEGAPSELHHHLESIATNQLNLNLRTIKAWPKAAQVLTRRINEYKATLSKVNIAIDKFILNTATGQTGISIKKKAKESTGSDVRSISSVSSEPSVNGNQTLDHAQKAGFTDDINGITDDISSVDTKVSSVNSQNYARNGVNDIVTDDTDDSDDILLSSRPESSTTKQLTTVVYVKDGYDVYCGRDFRDYKDQGWGNTPGKGLPREQAIEAYKPYFVDKVTNDGQFRSNLERLRGKRLGCWCKPEPCHCDIIADYVNYGRLPEVKQAVPKPAPEPAPEQNKQEPELDLDKKLPDGRTFEEVRQRNAMRQRALRKERLQKLSSQNLPELLKYLRDQDLITLNGYLGVIVEVPSPSGMLESQIRRVIAEKESKAEGA